MKKSVRSLKKAVSQFGDMWGSRRPSRQTRLSKSRRLQMEPLEQRQLLAVSAIPGGDITATASSQGDTYQAPEDTINGSGLNATGLLHDNQGGAETMWHTGTYNVNGNNPGTEVGAAWIKYEFDDVYELDTTWVWNFNQDSSTWDAYKRGFKNVTIEYSVDGANYTTLGEYVFDKSDGAPNYAHETEIYFNNAWAKYVVITAHTTDGNWGGNEYGLSEVRFFGTPLSEQVDYGYNVGAYYYPWYLRPISDTGTDYMLRNRLDPEQQPTIGWGDQLNPEVISQHYDWARAGGVDHFDCSFWGEGDTGDVLMRDHMLPHPNRGNIKLSVLLETITSDDHPAVTLSTVSAEMDYLANNYFNQDGYYTIDGKPVVYVYLTRSMSDANLHTYTERMRTAATNNGYPGLYIVGDEVWSSPGSQSGEASRLCGNLDAVTNYDVYGHMGAAADHYASAAELDTWDAKNAQWQTVCDAIGVDFIPCIAPGYNDRAIRLGHNALSRKFGSESGEFGSFFEEQLIRVKDNTDEDIGRAFMITSWNEWYEDTTIEPVSGGATTNVDNSPFGNHYTQDVYYEAYGTRYLDILREQTVLAVSILSPSADNPHPSNITEDMYTVEAEYNGDADYMKFFINGSLIGTDSVGPSYTAQFNLANYVHDAGADFDSVEIKAVAYAGGSPVFTETIDAEIWLYGDVDGNGTVNQADATLLASGTLTFASPTVVGDVDGNGMVEYLDAVLVYLHGSFDAGKYYIEVIDDHFEIISPPADNPHPSNITEDTYTVETKYNGDADYVAFFINCNSIGTDSIKPYTAQFNLANYVHDTGADPDSVEIKVVAYEGGNPVFTETIDAEIWLYGDVSGNGVVDGTDATLLASGTTTFASPYFVGDVDGNGMVEYLDAVLVYLHDGVSPFDAGKYYIEVLSANDDYIEIISPPAYNPHPSNITEDMYTVEAEYSGDADYMEFFINDSSIGTASEEPYAAQFNLANYVHDTGASPDPVEIKAVVYTECDPVFTQTISAEIWLYGDVSGDGMVNHTDVLLLMGSPPFMSPTVVGDVNGDGTVDNADALLVSGGTSFTVGKYYIEVDADFMAATSSNNGSGLDGSGLLYQDSETLVATPAVSYDLDNNSKIDLGDRALFADNYRLGRANDLMATLALNRQKQTAATRGKGDFNADRRVDDDDQAILARRWMMTVEDMDDDDARDKVFATVGTMDDRLGLFDE